MNKKDLLLSIVVPCKNEESDIIRCLDSIIKAISSIDKTEIIVVDCCSSDKTVEMAIKYPVNILQLRPDWPHSASAARYIGTTFASGEFIFFIDADVEVEPGFLVKALDVFSRCKNIAAVVGVVKEIYVKNDKIVGIRPAFYNRSRKSRKVSFPGGEILYRKSVLMEAGGFNPFLRAAEENELAQRIRKKNYSLISIPVPMAIHYTAPLGEWGEFIRKRKMNLFIGIGEAMRLSHSFKYLIETLLYYKEFTFFLFYFLFVAGLIITSFILEMFKYLYLSFLPLLIIYILLVVTKKSLKSSALGLVKWFSISIDILRGLIINPRDPKIYPKDPRIIKGDFDVQR